MGIYSEYIDKKLSFQEIVKERKRYLKIISEIRGRDILVYASDYNKSNFPNANISISPADLLPFKDQLSFINTKDIDVLLETPGGFGETVEDMVELIRSKYESVGIIIPGMAKSAGTIFSMGGDEILMGVSSALGPIDAQVISNGKRFSADAFLDGLEKIKKEVVDTGKLNPAYIPILQNISPGEIQHFENVQNFSRSLVKKWLSIYKFKYWEKHSSTGEDVTFDDKEKRADEIANKLCKHADWLTHGKSIRIKDLQDMRLLITDYTVNDVLNDAIERYYTLLRLTFDLTGICKIFETCDSQIYQSVQALPQPVNMGNIKNEQGPKFVHANIICPKCSTNYLIQLNCVEGIPLQNGALKYPINDIFNCPNCNTQTNISSLRLQIEAQTKIKIILK